MCLLGESDKFVVVYLSSIRLKCSGTPSNLNFLLVFLFDLFPSIKVGILLNLVMILEFLAVLNSFSTDGIASFVSC